MTRSSVLVVSAALLVGLSVVPSASADFLTEGPFLTDSAAYPQPAQGVPVTQGSYTDQVFGTTVRRVTSAIAPEGYVPEYSKAQAFNSDGSKFLVRATSGGTLLYDGVTLALVRQLPIPEGDVEPRWSPTDPDTLTYIDNSDPQAPRVMEHSLASGASRALGTYPGFGALSSGAEQERSRSGRYYALHGDQTYDAQSNFVSTDAFVADVVTGTRGPAMRLTPPSPGDFLDYVAITPDDQYVMVMWAFAGAFLYTRSWAPVRQLTDWDEHADFCRTSAGEDVLVIAHYRAEPNDEVVELIPLSGAGRRVIWQAPEFNMALHISCRNTDLPGWAFMSSYWDGIGQRPGLRPFENEVFALSLDSSVNTPIVRRLAHTRMNERADYFDEPHATVRQDGRLVLFGTNFNVNVANEGYADTYAVDLRDGAPTPTPTPTPTPAPVAKRAQRPIRCGGLPDKILRGRPTVVLPRTCMTNAGQKVRLGAVVSPAVDSGRRTLRVIAGSGGRISVLPTSRRALRIRLTLSAPATKTYAAFSRSKQYLLRRVG